MEWGLGDERAGDFAFFDSTNATMPGAGDELISELPLLFGSDGEGFVEGRLTSHVVKISHHFIWGNVMSTNFFGGGFKSQMQHL